MIYLDNAATTLKKPPQVAQAVYDAIEKGVGNASRGSHQDSLEADAIVFNAREKIAKLFGAADPSHVVFTMNITESLNMAIKGLVEDGSAIVTTQCEHNSVLRPLYSLERNHDVELRFVPADKQGRIDYDDFEKLMDDKVKVVVCTNASNLTGNRIDIAKVAEIAHKHGAILIVDAAQSAGGMPINMEEMGIDVLCFTGHKGLFGPQGTGGLCIRPGIEIKPLVEGGTGIQSYNKEQPKELPNHLEAGTLNIHGIAGLSAGVDYILEQTPEALGEQEGKLARAFYEGIKDIDGVTIYGDHTQEMRAPIVTINIRDYDSGEVSDALSQQYGISTRPGAHCAPLMHEALGTVQQGAVRFSFSPFNTEEDVQAAIDAVREIAKEE
ncbi:MAG: aminotransferase class V-fold PLP-dependent enzyme [Clostridia bacterium]|nr:aminotransferase class V-fold PLP-dependent enzyme [Clostridia bacterium]